MGNRCGRQAPSDEAQVSSDQVSKESHQRENYQYANINQPPYFKINRAVGIVLSNDRRTAFISFCSTVAIELMEGNLGWKFHLSVPEDQIEAAWNVILPIFLDERHAPLIHLKVVRQDVFLSELDPIQRGKQFTFYDHQVGVTVEQWQVFLNEIEMALRGAGIEHGNPVQNDRPVQGSHYFSYRYDADTDNNYIENAVGIDYMGGADEDKFEGLVIGEGIAPIESASLSSDDSFLDTTGEVADPQFSFEAYASDASGSVAPPTPLEDSSSLSLSSSSLFGGRRDEEGGAAQDSSASASSSWSPTTPS